MLHVRCVYASGNFRGYGKTSRSLRVVGLPERALEALEAHPPRLDTPLLFSTRRGTPINLNRWRSRQWTPGLKAAGIAHRSPYAMRHTFASLSIAADRPTFEIASDMGTGLDLLDTTHGHLLPDSAERGKAALDAYLIQTADTAEVAR